MQGLAFGEYPAAIVPRILFLRRVLGGTETSNDIFGMHREIFRRWRPSLHLQAQMNAKGNGY